jgi:hypothetical protein
MTKDEHIQMLQQGNYISYELHEEGATLSEEC